MADPEREILRVLGATEEDVAKAVPHVLSRDKGALIKVMAGAFGRILGGPIGEKLGEWVAERLLGDSASTRFLNEELRKVEEANKQQVLANALALATESALAGPFAELSELVSASAQCQDLRFDRLEQFLLDLRHRSQACSANEPSFAGVALAPSVSEVLEYLKRVREEGGRMPAYFPRRLRDLGWQTFAEIRQRVEVATDAERLDRFLLERQERDRASATELSSYAPLRARPESSGAENPMASEAPTTFPDTREWSPAFADGLSCAVVLGDPGSGKTWLLRHEAFRLACAQIEALTPLAQLPENVVIPIFVPLPAFGAQPATLEAYLRGLATEVGSGLLDLLRRGRCVVLMDGLDEVARQSTVGAPSPRESVLDRIAELQRSYPRVRLLVGCRLADYDRPPLMGLKEVCYWPSKSPRSNTS